MYKIELFFRSNIPCVYTSWTETADSDDWFERKLDRIVDYWLQSMCPYVDKTKLLPSKNISDDINFKYQIIQNHVKHLNSKNKEGDVESEFELICFEGVNVHNMKDLHYFPKN